MAMDLRVLDGSLDNKRIENLSQYIGQLETEIKNYKDASRVIFELLTRRLNELNDLSSKRDEISDDDFVKKTTRLNHKIIYLQQVIIDKNPEEHLIKLETELAQYKISLEKLQEDLSFQQENIDMIPLSRFKERK